MDAHRCVRSPSSVSDTTLTLTDYVSQTTATHLNYTIESLATNSTIICYYSNPRHFADIVQVREE